MEIQTFFLAEQVTRRPDNYHDVVRTPVASMKCGPETTLPAEFSLVGVMLVRRETSFGDTPFTLRFVLVDEDGRPIGQPNGQVVQSVFPDGHRFFALAGKIDFAFPVPGCYRLDVTLDEGMAGNVFTYDFDIVPFKEP